MKSTLKFLLPPLLFAGGCQTTTLQNGSTNATPKKFASESGKAKIYIYRLSGLAGAMRVESVFVDGRMLGQNGPGTFLATSVPPGMHTVSTTASSISLRGEAGEIYFVRQKMSSWGPTSSVETVNKPEGEQGVTSCNQAVALY